MLQNLAPRLPFAPQPLALAVGTGLGWVAWELSRLPDRGGFTLVTAAVVLLAGTASCTCWSLHRQAQQGRPSAAERMARVRGCLSGVGVGIALAMHALQYALA